MVVFHGHVTSDVDEAIVCIDIVQLVLMEHFIICVSAQTVTPFFSRLCFRLPSCPSPATTMSSPAGAAVAVDPSASSSAAASVVPHVALTFHDQFHFNMRATLTK